MMLCRVVPQHGMCDLSVVGIRARCLNANEREPQDAGGAGEREPQDAGGAGERGPSSSVSHFPCNKCDRVCKSKRGLSQHMTACRGSTRVPNKKSRKKNKKVRQNKLN